MNARERAAQYNAIGAQNYIKAQREFYSKNPDNARVFIDSHLTWPIATNSENRKTLLDLGCGTGEDLVKYLENDFDAYGTDSSQSMLDEASFQKIGSSRLKLARHTSLPFRDEVFDTVASRFSLHYLDKDQLEQTYSEVHRVLKPKGEFVAVARHPLVDLMAKPSKDYFKREETRVKLYGKVEVVTPSHILVDYISPLVKLFDLVDFTEATDQADIIPKCKFRFPTFIGFKAIKR